MVEANTPYESKRAEFRNYIDRSGIYNAMLRALKHLNKESPKPENLIYYIRHKLCETCPEDEKYDAMAEEVDRLGGESLRLDRELEVLQSRIKTPEEIEELCKKGLKQLQMDKEYKESYLLDYLNDDIIDELKTIVTSAPAESNLFDCVEMGFKKHEIPLGLSAPDAECFDLFVNVFEPCLKKAYEYKEDEPLYLSSTDWGEISDITNIDPEDKYVLQSYMIVSRNLYNTPFAPKMTEANYNEVEETILAITEQLKGEYAGNYLKLGDFNSHEQAMLYSKGLCFKANDPRLKAAKCYRFWPSGRGIFSNEDENFAVFVNWVDHLRVKSFAKNGDLGKIYYRLLKAFKVFDSNLFFARHEIYGFLSPDLFNLGSGIIAGVTMKLPFITKLDEEQLKGVLKNMGLSMKKLNKDKQTLEVQIAPSLERNEYAQVKTLNNACEYLINSEKEGKLLPDQPKPVPVERKLPATDPTTMGEEGGEATTIPEEGTTQPDTA